MLLSKVNSHTPRLPLPEHELRAAVLDGKLTGVVLRGVTPDGFLVEGTYQPDTGLPVPAVLVTRAGTEKTIKCPDRALACLKRLGVEEFEVDVSLWDPGEAFSPTRESYLSRQRRQNFEAAVSHVEALLAGHGGSATTAIQRLQVVTDVLALRDVEDIDLRALTLCWCEVFLTRWPVPDRAEKALYRYAFGSGIESEGMAQKLSDFCADEFKRRCKNQYLSSLDLGEAS